MTFMKETSGKKLVKHKFLYTLCILLPYLIGKRMPLLGIDHSAFQLGPDAAQAVMVQVLGSDANMSSIFALGITPSMFAGIIVQMSTAFRSREKRARMSPKVMAWANIAVTLVLAIAMAIGRLSELKFSVEDPGLYIKTFVVIQMVAGACVIQWLISRNKKYGLGGQSALIYINVADGLVATIMKADREDLVFALGLSLLAMIIMVFMENGEVRIPVKRISIHNVYGDKNYLSFKFNPIGVMPIMFTSAFFVIPQELFKDLTRVFPNGYTTRFIAESMVITKPIGAATYVFIYFLLSIFFSFVFVNPNEITENYLKSGDIIPGIHPDKPTKKYLTKVLMHLAVFSGLVMGTCIGLPLLLQLLGLISSDLMMMPSTTIMLTGIFMTIRSEMKSLNDYDSYQLFI